MELQGQCSSIFIPNWWSALRMSLIITINFVCSNWSMGKTYNSMISRMTSLRKRHLVILEFKTWEPKKKGLKSSWEKKRKTHQHFFFLSKTRALKHSFFLASFHGEQFRFEGHRIQFSSEELSFKSFFSDVSLQEKTKKSYFVEVMGQKKCLLSSDIKQ